TQMSRRRVQKTAAPYAARFLIAPPAVGLLGCCHERSLLGTARPASGDMRLDCFGASSFEAVIISGSLQLKPFSNHAATGLRLLMPWKKSAKACSTYSSMAGVRPG